jgi:2,4-dichlorophenol 6-monooxygenase
VPVVALTIGPGRDAHDIYDDWARAREVEESGCVLVRPDAHVAWRSATIVEDPLATLGQVMESLLGVLEPVGGETP